LRAGENLPPFFISELSYFGLIDRGGTLMPVPSLGFIAGPDVAKEDALLAKKKVHSWKKDRKLSIFADGNDRIGKAIRQFPRSMWMFKPTKEKWCIGEVLWHLADQEANLYIRLRKAVSEPGSAVTSYDQDKWAKNTNYLLGDFEEAWEILNILRKANARLLKRLPASTWAKKIKHPEQGLVSIEYMVGSNIWHLEHHLGQMAKRYREWKAKKK